MVMMTMSMMVKGDDDDDDMEVTFSTDVVSGREKNWSEAENKLAEEARLRFPFDFLLL